MSDIPKLTIGLPVYNGEEYLAESLTALLGQTFTDFELVISDNASTDRTGEICREFMAKDHRIRYVRQPVNIGAGPNHNILVGYAKAPYFKWASHDDLYAPELLERCVETLDAHPEAVLVHAYEAYIGEDGAVVSEFAYTLATDADRPSDRFHALLFGMGGDDFYGVIRTDVLRQVKPHDSYHHADRTFTTEIALYGKFLQVPEVLYFRRDHPNRAERSGSIRIRAANMDPKRAVKWRHPAARLYIEYIWGFISAVLRAPMSWGERAACFRHIGAWLFSRGTGGAGRQDLASADPAVRARAEKHRRSRLHVFSSD
jgi:glycosyltransferase involved in cell wall biosynthesis